ncbi:PAN domain-containing protein At5g03700-like [Bidens hawaiensis]|uniref:PAN domain-containing protein At5g03700-like n=1 Tax=Bidens hawaiensis TaxID=980011 RepID=UPI00404A2600
MGQKSHLFFRLQLYNKCSSGHTIILFHAYQYNITSYMIYGSHYYNLPLFKMEDIPSELTRIYMFIILLTFLTHPITAIAVTQELVKGFTATPDSSVTLFQPLLSDKVGNYSLGFLRVDRTQLVVVIIHVPSQERLWTVGKGLVTRWSSKTRLSFNGSLVISNERSGALWSSHTDGDRVRLLGTSNLLIEKVGDTSLILWQSFDFPDNTLMEGQNFTSAMTLVSSNGLYSMKLGSDFIGFYAKFVANSDPGHLYFQHDPMEAKARIIEGGGPIRVVVSPDGFLGMYQNDTAPVDVQPFTSFQQPGTGNRRVRLEPDGNLIGYYWTRSSWLVDFKQVADSCDLPSSCGPYGLCQRGKGCSCLDPRISYTSGRSENKETIIGSDDDLCQKKSRVIRRIGVELPNKEIMAYTIMSSLEKCERACEENCTCWGAVYSNTSGFCYTIDYPIQTLVEVLDDTKVGYFKVRESVEKDNKVIGLWVGLGLLCGLVLLILGIGGVILYKKESRGVKGYVEEDGLDGGVGPYKNLGSASFKSIELSVR